MALCCICGAETELYSCGSPVCVSCSEKSEASRKPPQASAGFSNTDARLNATRAAYHEALLAQREAAKCLDSLTPESSTLLENANRKLESATAAYYEALRDFIAASTHRRTG